MNTYTTYQPTNITWLGEIPSHWELTPIKALFNERNERNTGIKTDFILSVTKDRGVIPYDEKGLIGNNKSEDIEKYKLVYPNDLVINKMNVVIGSLGISKYFGAFSHVYLVYYPRNNNIYMKYFSHLFSIPSFYRSLIKYCTGIMELRESLNKDNFKNINLPLPPLTEQTAIRLKSEQIATLKEYRQALINECVTKGLNPNAALKNSGVVWLGDIPEHWAMNKFRHLFSFRKGLSITKENLQETGIPCVNYGEIHSKFGFSVNPQINELKCVSEDYLKNNQKSLLTYGDFIFADTSEDIEGSGNFTYLNSQMLTFAGYHTVVCSQKEKHNPRFLAYVFDSSSFRNQIRTKVKGVKVYSITQAILKDNFVWLPPLTEQTAIAEFLDKKTAQIDTALATYQAQIDKLNEYQRSLVNDVVTGKIDVRTI